MWESVTVWEKRWIMLVSVWEWGELCESVWVCKKRGELCKSLCVRKRWIMWERSKLCEKEVNYVRKENNNVRASVWEKRWIMLVTVWERGELCECVRWMWESVTVWEKRWIMWESVCEKGGELCESKCMYKKEVNYVRFSVWERGELCERQCVSNKWIMWESVCEKRIELCVRKEKNNVRVSVSERGESCESQCLRKRWIMWERGELCKKEMNYVSQCVGKRWIMWESVSEKEVNYVRVSVWERGELCKSHCVRKRWIM